LRVRAVERSENEENDARKSNRDPQHAHCFAHPALPRNRKPARHSAFLPLFLRSGTDSSRLRISVRRRKGRERRISSAKSKHENNDARRLSQLRGPVGPAGAPS
jgi:hypothetical protein